MVCWAEDVLPRFIPPLHTIRRMMSQSQRPYPLPSVYRGRVIHLIRDPVELATSAFRFHSRPALRNNPDFAAFHGLGCYGCSHAAWHQIFRRCHYRCGYLALLQRVGNHSEGDGLELEYSRAHSSIQAMLRNTQFFSNDTRVLHLSPEHFREPHVDTWQNIQLFGINYYSLSVGWLGRCLWEILTLGTQQDFSAPPRVCWTPYPLAFREILGGLGGFGADFWNHEDEAQTFQCLGLFILGRARGDALVLPAEVLEGLTKQLAACHGSFGSLRSLSTDLLGWNSEMLKRNRKKDEKDKLWAACS